jgi:hypothetical protein
MRLFLLNCDNVKSYIWRKINCFEEIFFTDGI